MEAAENGGGVLQVSSRWVRVRVGVRVRVRVRVRARARVRVREAACCRCVGGAVVGHHSDTD
eukprot:scaffold25349_cov40-Phaeocystis_antarctica.AAC.1